MADGYEPLTFGAGDSSDGGTTEKKRRYSVHDVDAEDNEVNYGQPDNPADDGNAIRIGSTSDDNIGDRSSMNRSSIHSDSHKSQEDDDNPNIYIHENVDDNDEYANEHIDADPNQYNEDFTDDQQQTGSGSNARDSKENTPDDTSNNNKKDEHFDTTHYRHPSLLDHELPASDEDIDKDHGRYLSTLIHEVNDS